MKYQFVIYFIFLLFSCYDNVPDNKKNDCGIIDIQPFYGMPIKDVKYVFDELLKVYPYVILKKAIPLPKSTYNEERNRYRADSLINFLNTQNSFKHITIGLTEKDISTTKGIIKDWGVMGLGYCPGSACIASSYRLSKNHDKNQLFKIAIHELGHTEGLQHCLQKDCFMQDAEGKNITNRENAFCTKCKRVLVNKGWLFKSTAIPKSIERLLTCDFNN